METLDAPSARGISAVRTAMNHRKVLPLLLLSALFAAIPEGLMVWKSKDLKSYSKAQSLADFGNHSLQINHRESDPEYSDSLSRNMLIWQQWPSEAPADKAGRKA